MRNGGVMIFCLTLPKDFVEGTFLSLRVLAGASHKLLLHGSKYYAGENNQGKKWKIRCDLEKNINNRKKIIQKSAF